MSEEQEQAEQIKKLGELIKDIRVGMLTTIDDDGSLRSRPMGLVDEKFDGGLWFFTRADAPKVEEIFQERQVNVSFAAPERQHYVSVSGTATIIRNRAMLEERWSPFFRAWFPQGLDDPNLALLHVRVHHGEYWDAPSSAMVHIFGLVKATLTGTPPSPGEHEKLDLAERERGYPLP
jgi:general stress protein 26